MKLSNPDLHKGNIAFEVPGLDGKSEENAMMTLGLPQCVPVFTRDNLHKTDSLPKYLVLSGSLLECVEQEDMRIKIIDLGEGSLFLVLIVSLNIKFFVAFFSSEAPENLHTPLQVRAPEVLFNDLSTLLRIEYGPRVDVWSIGCLVRLHEINATVLY